MSVPTPRRGFFKYSLDEVIALFEASHGRPSFKLSALGSLTDDELGRLVPAIVDASGVSVQSNHFAVTTSGRTTELFSIGSREEEVWARIDGQASLREIADALARDWGETGEIAFARVRHVFLHLVGSGICLPLNPLE